MIHLNPTHPLSVSFVSQPSWVHGTIVSFEIIAFVYGAHLITDHIIACLTYFVIKTFYC